MYYVVVFRNPTSFLYVSGVVHLIFVVLSAMHKKIKCTTPETYRKLVGFLKDNNIVHHTHQLKEESVQAHASGLETSD
jgi:hypothetical protein